MSVLLQCQSHTPLMNRVALQPAIEAPLRAALDNARKQTEAFDPELIVLFGPDHFNGVMYDMMPSFAIGAHASALGDYGTATGQLKVPTDLATRCARAVLDADVDIALSHRLRVDHGFVQTLELLTGGINRYPVLPVLVNCIGKPLPTTRRVRTMGLAIGAFLAREHAGKRILIVGSGGLSHDPPVPSLDTAPQQVRNRLINGIARSPDEQVQHEARVVAAARAFAQAGGQGSAENPMVALDPEWDRQILDWLGAADFAALDGLTESDIGTRGGAGGHEIRTWIAAYACLSAFGRYDAQVDYYQAIPEWIAGFAVAHARLR